MTRTTIALTAALALSACSAAQTATVQADAIAAAKLPAGQLFCQVQTNGGGTALVAIVNAEAAGLAPAATPVSVLATGMAKAFVDDTCAKAGGVAVAGPSDLNSVVQQVAVPVVVQALAGVKV